MSHYPDYIRNIVNCFDSFAKNCPEHKKDLEFFRTEGVPSLELVELSNKCIVFKMFNFNDEILLDNDGAFINNVNHRSLSKAVSFIARKGEQALARPKSANLQVGEFVL